MLCSWQKFVQQSCDCSFLLWCGDFLEPFLSHTFDFPERAHRLHYIVAGFSNSMLLLRGVKHTEYLPYVHCLRDWLCNMIESKVYLYFNFSI